MTYNFTEFTGFVARGCYSSRRCENCGIMMECGSSKLGQVDLEKNVAYVAGPCCCIPPICPNCKYDNCSYRRMETQINKMEIPELGGGRPCYPNHQQTKWDFRFLEMAKLISKWSKDPSTKCGAITTDKDRRIISLGYNGFAKGTDDNYKKYEDRDRKIATIVHCEENAILFSDRSLLKGATLYTFPFQPCAKCAGLVINAGITRCVAPVLPKDKEERWGKNIEIASEMFKEAGIQMDLIEGFK